VPLDYASQFVSDAEMATGTPGDPNHTANLLPIWRRLRRKGPYHGSSHGSRRRPRVSSLGAHPSKCPWMSIVAKPKELRRWAPNTFMADVSAWASWQLGSGLEDVWSPPNTPGWWLQRCPMLTTLFSVLNIEVSFLNVTSTRNLDACSAKFGFLPQNIDTPSPGIPLFSSVLQSSAACRSLLLCQRTWDNALLLSTP